MVTVEHTNMMKNHNQYYWWSNSDTRWKLTLLNEELQRVQQTVGFYNHILTMLQDKKLWDWHPYFLNDSTIMRYLTDNKQTFETTVMPISLSVTSHLLRQAHNELGYNGSSRTYMFLWRLYFWKGIKGAVCKYVKQRRIFQQRNRKVEKYARLHLSVSKSPIHFISMDLIGEFHLKSSVGNNYTHTVICLLSGYTLFILTMPKHSTDVTRAYIDHVCAKFGGSVKILLDNGADFKNKILLLKHNN